MTCGAFDKQWKDITKERNSGVEKVKTMFRNVWLLMARLVSWSVASKFGQPQPHQSLEKSIEGALIEIVI